MKRCTAFYRLISLIMLLAVLLPLGSVTPIQSARADSNVTFNNRITDSARVLVADPYAGWKEVGDGSASGGGISNTGGASGMGWMAIAPDDTFYIAWGDNSSGNYEIYVRHWNGSSWEEVGAGSASGGGISNTSGPKGCVQIAVAPDNTPYVAWCGNISGRSQMYVRRWNGSSWEEVGAGSASGGGISNTSCNSQSSVKSLAMAPNGTPYVAWFDDCGSPEVYVRRWNGTIWEEVGAGSASGGGISNTPWYSYEPGIAVGPDNVPYVVWHDNGTRNEDYDIYARRFYNNTWQEIGAGSASGAGIISPPTDWSGYAQIAIAPDGTPYVTWVDWSSGTFQIYVRRWNGSIWEEVGTGSASGGGISNTRGFSHRPMVAIAPDGTPYIAWTDYSSGDYEIYMRRWNGSIWEEVGTGSASGGGISNTSGVSAGPVIAIASDSTPHVAWFDNSSGGYEVYVRRFAPNNPPTADAGGPYSGNEGLAILLDDASASDPDDDTLTYVWSVDSTLCSFSDPTMLRPTVTCDDNGSYAVTLTVSDGVNDPVSSDAATVTVGNVAPTAKSNTPVEVDEGSAINLSLTDPSDPSYPDTSAGFAYAFDCGEGDGYGAFGSDNTAVCPTDDNGVSTVKGKIRDKDSGETEYTASVTVRNVAPTIESITAPLEPVNINDQPVSVSVTFSDPGAGDKHDVAWNWGDDNSDTQSGATSPASQDHTYSDAGVYAVQATVTDDDGDSDGTVYQFIVVYDTDGGFVTGGGWIWSEAGYCQLNDACDGAEGKANFGFVSKYKKGATTPTGNTEFQFKAGNLNFHSGTYDWLVVTGSDYAKFKGAGTINGEGDYKFQLWAGDSDPDTFRIKIWWEEGDVEHVIYDNGMDQPIAGGNIVVHTAKK